MEVTRINMDKSCALRGCGKLAVDFGDIALPAEWRRHLCGLRVVNLTLVVSLSAQLLAGEVKLGKKLVSAAARHLQVKRLLATVFATRVTKGRLRLQMPRFVRVSSYTCPFKFSRILCSNGL